MTDRLTEAVLERLLERARDERVFGLINDVVAQLETGLKNRPLSDFNVDKYGEGKLYHLSFNELGAGAIEELKDASFGFFLTKEAHSGITIEPRRWKVCPNGLVALGLQVGSSELKRGKDDASRLLAGRQKTLVHELTHLTDIVLRDTSSMAKHMRAKTNEFMSGDFDDEAYYTSDHELNAHFMGAVRDVIDDFAARGKTKTDAKRFVPNHGVLWRKLLNKLPAEMKRHNDEDALMRRFAGRLNDLWNKHVTSLPG